MPTDQKYYHKIKSVEPGSIAEELGVEEGDYLISINGQTVEDVFDYRYLTQDEELTVVIRKGTSSGADEKEYPLLPEADEEMFRAETDVEMVPGKEGPDEGPEEWELEIEKDPSEDLGIEFESGLMDEYRSCRNRCIFCFVNQMPKGMRSTLYFHDDDARLSFLQGNYITLTNMSDHDIDRIIRYHLEPINISFHTMNPALRCEMLHNKTAGDVFPKIMRLKEAGIELNGQIVLCRGINDGEELEYSLKMFEQYLPELRSVSVVPVGLTKYRDHLPKLIPFDGTSAGPVIDTIERWQRYYMENYGTHLVHASDEWYIMAGRELPPEGNYDGYLQLENGVGMVRLLTEEVREALAHAGEAARDASPERHVTVATGRLIGPIMEGLAREIMQVFPSVRADVAPITNHFFGELITVSGLITGQDLVAQLRGRDLGDALLLPSSMLRSGENVMLDDMTVGQVEDALQIKTVIVESDGRSLVEAVTGCRIG